MELERAPTIGLGNRNGAVTKGPTNRMFEDVTANPVELDQVQRLFLERAVAAMRDVGMTDDQINEALGRHEEPASFQTSAP